MRRLNYGLSDENFQLIVRSMLLFPEIESAVFFGSRAMGNYKKGSDVDIAIKGKEVTHKTTSRLHGVLNDGLPLPYFFDVLNYNTIDNNDLIQHIDNEGIEIYHK